MMERRNQPYKSGTTISQITYRYKILDTETRSDLSKLTFRYKAGRFDSSKGKYPAIRTKRMTPQDHTSADVPS